MIIQGGRTKWLRMKRLLMYLPLLGLPVLVCFIGPYLDGLGVLSGFGVLISLAGFLLLPCVISALFVTLVKKAHWAVRTTLFICTLVIQFFLLINFHARVYPVILLGTVTRFRHEFPPDQIRDCANQIRQKYSTGTLIAGERPNKEPGGPIFFYSPSAVVVSERELPASLRGRVKLVFIRKDDATDHTNVWFAVSNLSGIICNDRTNSPDDGHYGDSCLMADGVWAYRCDRP